MLPTTEWLFLFLLVESLCKLVGLRKFIKRSAETRSCIQSAAAPLLPASRSIMEPHPLAHDPDAAWKEMVREGATVTRLRPDTLLVPKTPRSLKIVCISDTHSRMGEMMHRIPDGDVLIHSGDFTHNGLLEEVRKFNEELGRLPHQHKLVVAGNHEKTFGTDGIPEGLLTNCTYLVDQTVEVSGYKFFGSPWMPEYPSIVYGLPPGRALFQKRSEVRLQIPIDTDVLITHTPPLGHGDGMETRLNRVLPFRLPLSIYRKGDVDLLRVIQERVKPRVHVFGHIHEAHGVTTDGQTLFVNAAITNRKLAPFQAPTQDPIVLFLPLPNPKDS